jgi:hypothetical protein
VIKTREASLRSKTNLSFISRPVVSDILTLYFASRLVISNILTLYFASRPVLSDILTLYFASRPVVSNILTPFFARRPVVSGILTLYFASRPVVSNTLTPPSASRPVGSDALSNTAASLLSIFGPFLYYGLPPWTYHVAKLYNDVHVISTWFLWAACLPNTHFTAFAGNTLGLHARNINVHIDNILSYLFAVVILLQDNNLVSPTRYYGHVRRFHFFSLRSRCVTIRHSVHYVRSVFYYMELAVLVPIFRM